MRNADEQNKLTNIYRKLNLSLGQKNHKAPIFDDILQEQKLTQKKVKQNPTIIEESKQEDIIFAQKEKDDLIDKDAIPWASRRTLSIRNPSLRLHNEIIEFYNYISPTEKEHEIRQLAFNRIKKFLQDILPKASIDCFGSFKTKLYLPNADIDIVAMDETMSLKKMYKLVAEQLLGKSNLFSQVNLISNAKVPIIKFVELESNFNFDLSFNKNDGNQFKVRNIKGLKQLAEIDKAFVVYPEMKYIIYIIKCMLRQRDLHETYSGGIGSFLLFQMVLTFLRQFRKETMSNDKERKIIGISNVLMSEYLIKFLEFYGVKFDYQRKKVLMVNGGSIVEKQIPEDRFSLISPQDQDHDVGYSSFKIKEIFGIFRNRFHFLTNYSFQKDESVLKYLLNPSNQKFTFLKEQSW